MSRPRCRSILYVVFFLWTAAPVRAADWPVPRGPSHEIAPYRYDPAAWKEVPKSFLEDSPACTLHSCTDYLVEADGTVETISHEITRFNGRKGIERLGEYKNITYDPTYQALTLNEARVIKADGRFVPIEPRHVQLRDLSTDYQVYDHDKQLIISFPSLEVGDAIEVKWTVRGRNPEYQGHFFTRYNFGDDVYPVVHDEIHVRVPKTVALKSAAIGGELEPNVRETGANRIYHWQVKDRPPLPQDDELPSKEDLRLQVAVSTFPSWEEVGRWKIKLRADSWDCPADAQKLVGELTKDLKTPLEKARALTYWVRRNIRYVSIGEKHDYTPHVPGAVLGNRYGDCKDQSQLLAVLLRQAGVPVALATLGTRDDGQVVESVPSPWGTHAILLVTIDGKDHWIDTTVSLAGWDFLPIADRNRLCYVVDDGGLRLVRTPAIKPEENRIDQTTRLFIGADGTSRCERSATYFGNAALSQRDAWVEVPPGERRRLMTTELQDSNSRAHLLSLAIDEKKLKDFDSPVSAGVTYEVSDHFTGDPVREGSVSDSKVWGKLLALTLDYDRTVAIDLWAPFELHHHYTIQLAPALQYDSLPRSHTVRSKWGRFVLKATANKDDLRRLDLDFLTRLDKPLVNPADFEEFRQFHEDVNKHYRAYLSLRTTDDAADAPALEAWLYWLPKDSTSALTLAKLYQQQGKVADARRVLRRARLYRPEDAALWELAVQVAENLQEEEATFREMIRKFPDEPKYSVALGATLLSHGEYAKARTALEPIAAKGPAALRSQAHYQLARADFREGKPDQALTHLTAAERADPEGVRGVPVLLFKALVLEKLGRDKDARATYGEVLTADADSAEALVALVRLELTANDQEAALDHLRRYTLAVGKDVDGLMMAAELHLRLGRYEDAFDLANRAREAKFDPRAQAILGLVHLHRGDWARAVFHLEKAEPDAPVLEGLLRAYLELGQFRAAEDLLPKAQQVSEPTPALLRTTEFVTRLVHRRDHLLEHAKVPAGQRDHWKNAINHYVAAEHARQDGRSTEQVRMLLEPVAAEGVDFGPAHALRGVLDLEQGRLTRALVEAEKALALDPEGANGYYVRGRVRLERAQETALVDLEKAARLSERKHAEILHWLAAALFQQGKRDEALATQREALKLKPKDPDLVEQFRAFTTARP